MLNGSLEQDKLFAPGDKALVVVSHSGGEITNVTMSDHYRLGWELVMALAFAALLIRLRRTPAACGPSPPLC